MPETWAMYGVDANGDGVADPNNPEDAIFAAARYLSAAGMPADICGAIFAYNHADWYVEEVLANAGCYADEVGSNSSDADGLGAADPGPELHAGGRTGRSRSRRNTCSAFEAAAARYELGKRGVWTLAAIARLESNFGRGMDKQQLRTEGPLGLDPMEWHRYAVDGDKDGKPPPRRHRRLGGDAGAADLVARQHRGRRLHPQPGRLVRRRGRCTRPAKSKAAAKSATSTGAIAAAGDRLRRRRAPNRVLTAERPRRCAPPERPARDQGRDRRRQLDRRHPLRLGRRPRLLVLLRLRLPPAPSASPSTARGLLDTPAHLRLAWRATANPAPAAGSRSTPAPPTPTWTVAGLRWDTVGDAEGTGAELASPSLRIPEGFVSPCRASDAGCPLRVLEARSALGRDAPLPRAQKSLALFGRLRRAGTG